jgi:hypothetical protein
MEQNHEDGLFKAKDQVPLHAESVVGLLVFEQGHGFDLKESR